MTKEASAPMPNLEQMPMQGINQMTSASGLGSYETSMPNPNTQGNAEGAMIDMQVTPIETTPPQADNDPGRFQAAKEAAHARLSTVYGHAAETVSAGAEALRSEEAAAARAKFARTLGGVAVGLAGRTARDLGVIKGNRDKTRVDPEGFSRVFGTTEKGKVPKTLTKAVVQNIKPSDVYKVGRDYVGVARATRGAYKQAKANKQTVPRLQSKTQH